MDRLMYKFMVWVELLVYALLHRRTIRIVFGLLALLFACAFCAFDFHINRPGEIESAHARWDAQNIDSYRYRVMFGGALTSFAAIHVTVIDNEITQIEQEDPQTMINNMFNLPTVTDTPPELSPIGTHPNWYEDYDYSFPGDLGQYTVDGLFTFFQERQRELPQPLIDVCGDDDRYEVSFSSEKGFIERVVSTSCPAWDFGVGLMCPAVADCAVGFSITEFEILPE